MVKYVGGVYCFEGVEGLVDEVLVVVVRKILGMNDVVYVCFYEFL